VAINIRNKGKRGELTVAKMINKALGTNVRRTPNSGGLSIRGDIIDISPDSVIHDCHFEIKNTKTVLFPKWWDQATGDAISKKPTLVFKHKGQWICVQYLNDWLEKISEPNDK